MTIHHALPGVRNVPSIDASFEVPCLVAHLSIQSIVGVDICRKGVSLDQLRTLMAPPKKEVSSAAGRRLHRAQSVVSQTQSSLGIDGSRPRPF
jgi:hypothetical protein